MELTDTDNDDLDQDFNPNFTYEDYLGDVNISEEQESTDMKKSVVDLVDALNISTRGYSEGENLKVDPNNKNYVIRHFFSDKVKSSESLLTTDTIMGDSSEEGITNTKQNFILTLVNILKNAYIDQTETNISETFNTSTSYTTLFNEYISNFLSGNNSEVVLEAILDLLLPSSYNFKYNEIGLNSEAEYFDIIPSVMYFCIINGFINECLAVFDSSISSFNSTTSQNTNNIVSSVVLPTSRVLPEINYLWMQQQSRNQFIISSIPILSQCYLQEGSNMLLNSKFMPRIIERCIYFMLFHCDELLCRNLLKSGNNFLNYSSTISFNIGRLLEICLSRYPEDFINLFLQYNGLLVILNYIGDSSIQDFLFRLLGIIGFAIPLTHTLTHISSSFIDFDFGDCNFGNNSSLDMCTNNQVNICNNGIGLSSILYKWILEYKFIDYLLYPINVESQIITNSSLRDIYRPCLKCFIGQQILETDINPNIFHKLVKCSNCVLHSSSNQQVIFGIVEFLTRLIEYLRPDQSGLPMNMTSLGLQWQIYTQDNSSGNISVSINTPNNVYSSNVMIPSSLTDTSTSTYYKAYNLAKSLPLDSIYSCNLPIKRNSSRDDDYNSSYSLNNPITDNFINKSTVNFINKDSEPSDSSLDSNENDLRIDACMQKVCHALRNTLQFLNSLIVDSSLIQILCKYILLRDNNQDQTISIRILNFLELLLNVSFSQTSNILGCLKGDILQYYKQNLNQFCKFLLLRYNGEAHPKSDNADSQANNNSSNFSQSSVVTQDCVIMNKEINSSEDSNLSISYVKSCNYREVYSNKKRIYGSNFVSVLTIIKLICYFDDTRESINNINCEFWDFLVNLLVEMRENSLISVQCKSILELGVQYGSNETLEILFYRINMVTRLSKFIYNGIILNNNQINMNNLNNNNVNINETMSTDCNDLCNKVLKKKKNSIFGPITSFFLTLGQLYDSLLQTILSCETPMYKNIKMELFRKLVEINDYKKDYITYNEYVYNSIPVKRSLNMGSESYHKGDSNICNENNFQIGFGKDSNDYNDKVSCNSYKFFDNENNTEHIDCQRITTLLFALSCHTQSHSLIVNDKISNDNNYENCSISPNSYSLTLEESGLHNQFNNSFNPQIDTSNINSNNLLIKHSADKNSVNMEFTSDKTYVYLKKITDPKYVQDAMRLVKCSDKCTCPIWSFSNILRNLREQKNSFSCISSLPVLSLEESKRVRETRKKQMKLQVSQKL
ncbi:uncharacterized protein CMU_036840 [Cryptosporidium muris RN66]|uniref:Uncharacterized protein n=1 Tax=Cryptosporidium muris (strain RN66) TaxID=441375 RepID=B6AH19_CRYMR|nr:uncharacterized protein CMU_036840 [Cryptosporidium muris RN66]EEA07510.1 hypothetical protein, conserved [Cryptosporidium muris RN66]|eukprot:XP_002141859.1 hypothetical protein [Cryptosporidium muris RN66]